MSPIIVGLRPQITETALGALRVNGRRVGRLRNFYCCHKAKEVINETNISISNGWSHYSREFVAPHYPPHLLLQSRASLISTGTERMLREFGKANLFDKALQQPDKVKQVADKISTDGVMPTIDAIRSKLDQPLPLGYSNVGVVAGNGSTFSVGDRVVSNGYHAEVVLIPKNLCALIPDNVDDESAAFTVPGAIALQGMRLAQPTLGEVFIVTGLGLVGLLTVQLLLAQGCRVLGIDFDSGKCDLARSFGATTVDLSEGEDPIAVANVFSRGRGVDGDYHCQHK